MKTHPGRAVAGSSLEQMPWPARLGHRVAGDLLGRSPVVIGPELWVKNAEQLGADLGIHHLVVTTPSREPLGVLCMCDLWGERPDLEVHHCMSAPADTVDRDAPLTEVADVVSERHRGCVPVLDEGRVVGLLTRGDLRRAGVLMAAECPQCVVCQTFHHVRTEPGTGALKCLKCLNAGRSWEFEDDEEIEYGGGD